LSLVWLFLAFVTCYLNCLDRVVLAYPFWALATFPVCFSVLSCWTNRAPSTPSSSTFLHSCRGSWLFASNTHYSHDPASMSVDVSTISPSSYTWCYHFFSQRKQIQASSIILCCQLWYYSIHSTNAFTQTSSIKLRNSFEGHHLVDLIQVCSLTSWSRISSPLLVALSTVHDDFRIVIFFLSRSCVVMMLWLKRGWQSCFLLVYMIPVLDRR